jgi:hypothetical protein
MSCCATPKLLNCMPFIDRCPKVYEFGLVCNKPVTEVLMARIGNCDECIIEKPAIAECIECQEKYCNLHAEAHKKSKRTAGHSVSFFGTCHEHPFDKLSGYCKTHKEPFCDSVQHIHKHMNCDEKIYATGIKKEINEIMAVMNGISTVITNSKSMRSMRINYMNEHARDISEYFSHYIENLQSEIRALEVGAIR